MTQKRPFDLVILDLDGTILDLYHAGGISPRVRQTIAAVQAAGIPVTIGSGRTLDYIQQHLAGVLNLTVPAITTQGAVIGDPVTGQIVSEVTMPLAAARAVAAWIDDAQPTTVFYFNEAERGLQLYQNRFAVDPANLDFHEHVFGAPRALQPTFAPLLQADDALPPLKFIIDNDPHHEPDLLPPLQTRFGDVLTITRTHQRLVEGTAPGIDKGRGVHLLCQHLGIDPQRVMAIGDNDNDIPLLQAVGFGVAMGNATPGAKQVAKWIAPSISEDGAAVALERWILNRDA